MAWTFNNTSIGRLGTIQSWRAPHTGLFKIEATGAKAGTSRIGKHGRGAYISGEISLNKGDVLQILVGQMGGGSSYAGGGGGTFVALGNSYSTATPLVVAGGGGSAGECGNTQFNQSLSDGQININGANGTGDEHGIGGNSNSNAATCGQGYCPGAGGGGFYVDGKGVSPNSGGKSFRNGGQGGLDTNNNNNYTGGFGGGGGGYDSGGGAGGYRGGGGGGDSNSSTDGSGGGGGSIIATNSLNVKKLQGIGTGHGIVKITPILICETKEATDVGIFSAKLNGFFVTDDTTGQWYFEYGTTSSYGTSLLAGSGGVMGPNSLNYDLPELLPNTAYHYRSKLVENGITKYGEDKTFTTKSGLATITTDTVTATGATTADAKGTIVSFNE